jgi:HSP20 family molecular chaperone IbpA
MDFSGSETYEADSATVFAMFCDDDATRARYESAGHRDAEIVEHRQEGDDLLIRSRRVVTVDLPGFAKKVLSPTNTMLQTDRWGPETAGVREGTFDVDVEGAPVKISGTMRLEATDDDRCRHSVHGTVEVKIPLLGGRIAKWAGKDAGDELAAEFAFNKARLAGDA